MLLKFCKIERLFCTNMECNRANHSPSNMVNIVAIPIVRTSLQMCLQWQGQQGNIQISHHPLQHGVMVVITNRMYHYLNTTKF